MDPEQHTFQVIATAREVLLPRLSDPENVICVRLFIEAHPVFVIVSQVIVHRDVFVVGALS